MSRLHDVIGRVRPVDGVWMDRAASRIDRLTKPPRSLGRLEWIAGRLCAIQETVTPRAMPRRIAVFAADHGVAADGVSAYPSVVTAQMVGNFLRGGAAINVLARQAAADVCVVDVGVTNPIKHSGDAAAFVSRCVRAGSGNISRGPAMSRDDLAAAIEVGLDIADAAAADGVALLACGDMGIGNTTAASAITAAITGTSAVEVTGVGTGIDREALPRKVAVVEQALRVNQPGRAPLEVLRKVGGLEIAAIVGTLIGAAARRVTVIGDGFIASGAALVAAEICPAMLDYWFAGHQSSEPGHRVQLAYLRQRPLLDLEMRLGEGTGAALAMSVIGAAAAIINEMATFESAGVADSSPLSAPGRSR